MIKLSDTHSNRTGAMTNPALANEMVNATKQFPNEAGDGEDDYVEMRMLFLEEGAGTGTMPPVTTLKGAGKTLVKSLRGNLDVLIDKLGERLAFERAGVRLYDLLIEKLDVHKSWNGGPTRELLTEIRDEELEHFLFLQSAMQQLGADPTAVTPSANLHDVASSGIRQVIADARTDLEEGLEAILVAELADNDCWSTLITLATNLGEEELADECERCFDEEEKHLNFVRGWLKAALGAPSYSALTPLGPTHPNPRERSAYLRGEGTRGDPRQRGDVRGDMRGDVRDMRGNGETRGELRGEMRGMRGNSEARAEMRGDVRETRGMRDVRDGSGGGEQSGRAKRSAVKRQTKPRTKSRSRRKTKR